MGQFYFCPFSSTFSRLNPDKTGWRQKIPLAGRIANPARHNLWRFPRSTARQAGGGSRCWLSLFVGEQRQQSGSIGSRSSSRAHLTVATGHLKHLHLAEPTCGQSACVAERCKGLSSWITECSRRFLAYCLVQAKII